MTYQETIARQCLWAIKSIEHNLNFIPEDKFTWKPAPTAKSAQEITHHILGNFAWVGPGFFGQEPNEGEVLAPATREEAKTRLMEACESFAASVRALPDADLSKEIDMGFGPTPLARMLSVGALDGVNHLGQITYIQSLLGDAEDHIDIEIFNTL